MRSSWRGVVPFRRRSASKPVGTWGTQPSGTGLWVVRNNTASTTFDPGMPYGSYDLCVRDTAPNPDQYQTFVYHNNVAGGQPATTEAA